MKAPIRIGLKDDGTPLAYSGDGHITLTGPTRSGKLTRFLAGIGLSYKGSLIGIDPKAQFACITKRRREQFGPVHVVNPFGLFRDRLGPPARFNPLIILDPKSPGFVADCDGVAEGIIAPDTDGKDDRHFTDSARQLIAGGIMHLLTASDIPPENRTLGFLYRMISQDVFTFAKDAEKTGTPHVKARLGRFAAARADESREIGSIISVAATQSAFLGIDAIAQSLAGSDFDFRDLKRQPTTIYLTLPTEYVDTAGKWFRLVLASALKVLLREPEQGEDVPVLAILDEFSNMIGRLSIMETAMSLAAGYGLQLLPVLQDLNQLKRHYPQSYESFLANSEAQIYFTPRDATTAEYVSKLSGEKEIRALSVSVGDPNIAAGSTGLTHSYGSTVVPVLRLHEVLRLPKEKYFRFSSGRIFIEDRPEYFDATLCPEFKGMYDPDPYFRG